MTLEVVSGIYRRGACVLMQRRDPNAKRPGMWELAGGKVEAGETRAQALVREWLEEIGVDIKAGRFIASAMLDVEVSMSISLIDVRDAGGPNGLGMIGSQFAEGSRLAWVEPSYAVEHMPCTPGFYLHYSHIVRWMHKLWV